ncbi:thioredoxin [Mailhella massiliensis]|uniref:Thioredoxin n=1 Tax=Mailhella massiliensis TaxID=1903261 RepID=A0A921AYD6_9BACT|nr:thioredoxin [Mailhella massiliensis]HJD98159.1 thioredoxin [Mailhella massiliensis]
MSTAVTDATFESVVIKSSIPVLVDFWAPWCGPCRGIGPIVEELAAEYEGKALVCKVNVDENNRIPSLFGIRAIPTLIVFKDGEVVDQVTGAVAKSHLVSMLEKAF